jgi:hypothetical protein
MMGPNGEAIDWISQTRMRQLLKSLIVFCEDALSA